MGLQDLRTAFRVLAKSPGATALSVLSIAFGIGLTAGIFSVGDALRFRPMPFRDPAHLYQLSSIGDDGREMLYGWPDYLDMAAAANGSAEIAAYQRRGGTLQTGDELEHLMVTPVTPNYFSLIGVRALAGSATVESGGGQPQIVLGHRLWQRRFGGDPGIVGKTVVLSRRQFLVAGVMPAEFAGLARGIANDVWMSHDAWFHVLGNAADQTSRGGQFEMIARLSRGVSPQRAAAVLEPAIRGAGKHRPAPAGSTGTVLSADFAPTWRENLTYGGGLLATLLLVLFVACANVAQLRLAQAESRKKELGVRMALGAGGWRIGRQLLVETAIIAACGAALGIPLAQALMEKAAEFLAAGRTFIDYGIRLDGRVLAFTLLAIAISIVVSGLAPARHAVSLNIAEIIKSEQGATGARRGWYKKLLVAGQIAVSVALFGTAALLLTSLRHASAIHPGLDPTKNLYVMNVVPGLNIDAASWCDQACARLSETGGARGATFARRLPLSGSGGGMTARVEIPGLAPMGVPLNNVGGNYFALLGTHVVAGRGIGPEDRAGSEPVVVISQTFARQVFPGRNPIGEWVRIHRRMRHVVGVAEDGPSNALHEPAQPFIYLPYTQEPSDDIALMVETFGRAESLAPALRAALRRFDPKVVIYSTQTLRQQMDEALSTDRMNASISSGLGIFGLLLTAAGLFGVLMHTVSRRTREFGLRMALGARPVEIERQVFRESLKIAAWGIPAGLLLLAVAGRYVRSWLLGVEPLDPGVYLASAAAAVVLTLVAAWIPARRATRVDPIAALRSE